jgi:diadenosine tetraphosphate (Ap4A) HIT family hydrolase
MAYVGSEDIICETKHFQLSRSAKPFVSREEGGHMRIFARRTEITERRDFTPEESVEFIWLSSIAGEALDLAMNERGVKIMKINFEELGNWPFRRGERVQFHLHIFGRAEGSKHQVFPEAVHLPDRSTGFYDGFEPLNEDDMKLIRNKIDEISQRPKYADKDNWRLHS